MNDIQELEEELKNMLKDERDYSRVLSDASISLNVLNTTLSLIINNIYDERSNTTDDLISLFECRAAIYMAIGNNIRALRDLELADEFRDKSKKEN